MTRSPQLLLFFLAVVGAPLRGSIGGGGGGGGVRCSAFVPSYQKIRSSSSSSSPSLRPIIGLGPVPVTITTRHSTSTTLLFKIVADDGDPNNNQKKSNRKPPTYDYTTERWTPASVEDSAANGYNGTFADYY